MINKEYWIKRNENLFLSGERKGLKLAERMQQNYEKALKQITSEIYITYNKYAKEGKLDLTEAKRLLNKTELKTFKQDLKEFLDFAKSNNFRNNEKNQLKLMQLKARVSRLEELKTRINFELSKLTKQNETEMSKYLSDVYENGYYKTIFNVERDIGFAISFTELNTKLIEKAISTNYQSVNYSYALWKNKDNLMTILEQVIPQGLTLGYNPNKLSAITDKKLKTGFNNTVRLIRTEYNLLLNKAASDGYKEAGIEQYQILATLDDRTSEICQEMDGKIFDLDKQEIGINHPPFHPNCRTTTIPYFEPDEIDEEFGIGSRLAKDDNGNYYEVPANMTYKQWRDGKVEHQTVKSELFRNKLSFYQAKSYTLDDVGILNRLYNNQVKNLTKEEIAAIRKYSSTEHNIINTYLKLDKTPSEEVGDLIDNITNAIDKNNLVENTVLYRGVGYDRFSELFNVTRADLLESSINDLKKSLVGKRANDLTFTSTYAVKDIKYLDDYDIVLNIAAPKNTNALYINSISLFKDIEYEILLQRGLNFEIVDIYRNNKNQLCFNLLIL